MSIRNVPIELGDMQRQHLRPAQTIVVLSRIYRAHLSYSSPTFQHSDGPQWIEPQPNFEKISFVCNFDRHFSLNAQNAYLPMVLRHACVFVEHEWPMDDYTFRYRCLMMIRPMPYLIYIDGCDRLPQEYFPFCTKLYVF